MISHPSAGSSLPLSAARVQSDGTLYRLATYALIALCCAPTLFLPYLPMRELPQYAALSRMLLHLHDPEYGFAAYYELDFGRGASVLVLALWGVLADVLGLALATKLMVWTSLVLTQFGMCAVLRAQRKPVVLALLGLPFAYANTFYLGLVPSALSFGLALWAIAWMLRLHEGHRAQRWLAAISCALPLTHPVGMIAVLLFAACWLIAHGRAGTPPWLGSSSDQALSASASDAHRHSEPAWRRALLSLWPLIPSVLGGIYWLRASLRADGVAAYNWPGLAARIMLAPRYLIGGWTGNGDAWLLCAALVLWLYLCRPVTLRSVREDPVTLASWCVAALCLVGYFLLPSSTWSSSAICERAGSALLAFLPVLVPHAGLTLSRHRGPLLLIALAAVSCWYSSTQLARFATEAAHFDAVLAVMPARPKLWTLAYDSQGELARGNPYMHVAAYAQAQRGGFLSLSQLDYAWTVPLRRRKSAPAPAPIYGSEWDPSAAQILFELYDFYDNILTIGKEPREMTILMHSRFEIAAHSGMFVLYSVRPSATDP